MKTKFKVLIVVVGIIGALAVMSSIGAYMIAEEIEPLKKRLNEAISVHRSHYAECLEIKNEVELERFLEKRISHHAEATILIEDIELSGYAENSQLGPLLNVFADSLNRITSCMEATTERIGR